MARAVRLADRSFGSLWWMRSAGVEHSSKRLDAAPNCAEPFSWRITAQTRSSVIMVTGAASAFLRPQRFIFSSIKFRTITVRGC